MCILWRFYNHFTGNPSLLLHCPAILNLEHPDTFQRRVYHHRQAAEGSILRMKRALNRLAAFLVLVALLAGVCYLLWPHSFAGLQPECDSVTILRIDTAEDYSPITTKKAYSADSAEFRQIIDILSRYTYHRSFRTLTKANNTDSNHAGFWLHVYLDHGNDRVDFTCGGTGEILIDGIAWRVGYWGNHASLSMMAELAAVLGKQERLE